MPPLECRMVQHSRNRTVVEYEKKGEIDTGVLEINLAFCCGLLGNWRGEDEEDAVVYWNEYSAPSDLRDGSPERGTRHV